MKELPLLKFKNMEQEKDNQNYSLFFILGAIFGVLTGWVVTESIVWAFLGAIIGLLFASFFVNALVKGRTY